MNSAALFVKLSQLNENHTANTKLLKQQVRQCGGANKEAFLRLDKRHQTKTFKNQTYTQEEKV